MQELHRRHYLWFLVRSGVSLRRSRLRRIAFHGLCCVVGISVGEGEDAVWGLGGQVYN